MAFLSQLEDLAEQDVAFLQNDVASRHRALQMLQTLLVKIESPIDTVLRLVWKEMSLKTALQICHEIKAFDVLATTNDFMSLEHISKSTNDIDPNLLRRFLRHIAAMGFLREGEVDHFASTPFSNAMTDPKISSAIEFWSYFSSYANAYFPQFLQETGYRNPSDAQNSAFQLGRNTKLNFWDWLNKNPTMLASFANHMAGYSSTNGNWLDVYPGKRVLDGADEDGPLLVDVGGGVGQDLERFRTLFPQLKPGRLILQEQLEVIEAGKGKLNSSISGMVHDFYTPQPVQSESTTWKSSSKASLPNPSQMPEHTFSIQSFMIGQTMCRSTFFAS
jgi:hypothetical protein